MDGVKKKLLATLNSIRPKVNLRSSAQEFVVLNGKLIAGDEEIFYLVVELIVNKKEVESGYGIESVEVHHVEAFKNDGGDINFGYTKKELINYIINGVFLHP